VKGGERVAKLLTMKEAMAYTGLSRQKLLYFIDKGNLSFIDLSEGKQLRRYRFQTHLLDEFLDKASKTKGRKE